MHMRFLLILFVILLKSSLLYSIDFNPPVCDNWHLRTHYTDIPQMAAIYSNPNPYTAPEIASTPQHSPYCNNFYNHLFPHHRP